MVGNLVRQRGFADAAAKLQRAYELVHQFHPKPHLYKAVVLYFLGEALEKGGKLSEAEVAHGRCLEIARQTVGWEHPHVPLVAVKRARLLTRLHRKEEAARLIAEVLEAEQKRYGKNHYFVANSMMLFADLYEELQDYPAQARMAGNALAIYDHTGGTKRRLFTASQRSLARATSAMRTK